MVSISKQTVEAIIRIERISSDDAHRPTLNAVHFHDGRILASNGHIATSLPLGVKEDAQTLNGYYIHASDIEYLKALLKSKKTQSGFDLGFDTDCNLTLAGAVFYRAHNEYQEIQTNIVRVMTPAHRTLPVTIAFNAAYLKDLAQAMDPRKNNHVRVTFDALNTLAPICVTIAGEDGPHSTVMPVRMDDRDDLEQRTRDAAEALPRLDKVHNVVRRDQPYQQ